MTGLYIPLMMAFAGIVAALIVWAVPGTDDLIGFAVYLGCCPHRREGSVRFGTLTSSAPMRTPDRGLVLAAPGGRLPKIV